MCACADLRTQLCKSRCNTITQKLFLSFSDSIFESLLCAVIEESVGSFLQEDENYLEIAVNDPSCVDVTLDSLEVLLPKVPKRVRQTKKFRGVCFRLLTVRNKSIEGAFRSVNCLIQT